MQSLQNLFLALKGKEYPTSQEIMAKAIKYKKRTIKVVTEWKLADYKDWNNKPVSEKLYALYRLVTSLSQVYNKPVCIVNGTNYEYRPFTMTLVQNVDNPSIISTLHEFSHHINGTSEKLACRWSVWLFKTVFPKSFNNLEFIPNSHMLCKKPTL